MDRRVQIVDQLRADGRLSQDELHGGLRVARVAIDDADKRVKGRRRVDRESIDRGGQRPAQAVERLRATAQVLASLAAVLTRVFGRQALRSVTKAELVRLLDRVAARSKISERLGSLWSVRAQTQISVSPCPSESEI